MINIQNSYHLTQIYKSNRSTTTNLLQSIKYKFTIISNKQKIPYLILVEEYKHNIFIIKFYPAKEEENKHKYEMITNHQHAFRILATVVNCAFSIVQKNEFASFGFIGAQKIKNGQLEDKLNTQRSRIYQYIAKNYLSTERFLHSYNEKNSAYLLINKRNQNYTTIQENAIILFTEEYPDLIL